MKRPLLAVFFLLIYYGSKLWDKWRHSCPQDAEHVALPSERHKAVRACTAFSIFSFFNTRVQIAFKKAEFFNLISLIHAFVALIINSTFLRVSLRA